jgi:predicted ATP-dependent endonuclease of OLD family
MNKFIEVVIIVEGRTEQLFVEKLLSPYLASKNIFICATQVTKPGQKG